MPLCGINEGLLKGDCSFLIGGIESFAVANRKDVIGFTDSDLDGIYDTVQMSTAGTAGTAKFYLFETTKNSSNYTTVLTPGASTNIIHTVDLFVPRSDQSARDIAVGLSLGEFVIIAKTRMQKQIVLGWPNGLTATAGDVNSGVAESDLSSVHITLAAANFDYGVEFSGTIPL